MDNLDLEDQAFLFVYELLHIKKLLSETNQGLTQNAYGSILMINVISLLFL